MVFCGFGAVEFLSFSGSMQNLNPTQAYYDQNAQTFIQGTLAVDMQALYTRFTACLPPHAQILDAGCGSGRDSLFFRLQGYEVLAIDACETFVAHTRSYAGVAAQCLRFDQLEFESCFDGIWASASLLHLPLDELAETLQKLAKALRPAGVLYASFKYGDFAEFRHGRWFTDLNETRLQSLLQGVPELKILETWQSSDARPERAHECWLNCLLQCQSGPTR